MAVKRVIDNAMKWRLNITYSRPLPARLNVRYGVRASRIRVIVAIDVMR
jgi:hypothetical protein